MDKIPDYSARAAQSLTTLQKQALAVWAKQLSNQRIEAVRTQLWQAITAYDPRLDHVTTVFALEARRQAVVHEIERRGGVPSRNLIIIPWGMSLVDTDKWSMTDFAQLPPSDEQQLESPLSNRALERNDQEPAASSKTYREESRESNMATGTLGYPQYFPGPVEVYDNNGFEAYRLAENDLSGLPIISTCVIDNDNLFGIVDHSDFFDADTLPRLTTPSPSDDDDEAELHFPGSFATIDFKVPPPSQQVFTKVPVQFGNYIDEVSVRHATRQVVEVLGKQKTKYLVHMKYDGPDGERQPRRAVWLPRAEQHEIPEIMKQEFHARQVPKYACEPGDLEETRIPLYLRGQ